jgi:cupin fold WbuC family metalloprotein
VPNFRVENPEVYYAREPFSTVSAADVQFLKDRALENERKRSRLCLHLTPADAFHEMIIVHHCSAYVRPHRHRKNAESFGVLEGTAVAFTFDDAGAVTRVLHLDSQGSEASRYRMPAGEWHSIVVTSEWLVFAEAALGPFSRENVEFPSWAPDGSVDADVRAYCNALEAQS